MSTPLFLLIGLAIATCIIAYWSDNLGKKLGKKRVTLFGLRPRQTATLMTMTSSVVIMLFTLGVLLATNSGLRGALLRYDKERAENRALRRSNGDLRGQQAELQKDVRQAQDTAKTAYLQAKSAQQQAFKAHDNYQKALQDVNAKQQELKAAQKDERLAQAEERKARSGEKKARSRADAATHQLQNKKQELQNVNGRLENVQVRLNSLQTNLKSAQQNIKLAQAQERTANTKATRAYESYKKIEGDAYEASRKLIADITNLQEEKQSLENKQQVLQASIQQLEITRNQLELVKNQLATQDTDIRQGVFADVQIPAGTSPKMTSDMVKSLLQEGQKIIAANNSRRRLSVFLPNHQPVEDVAISYLATSISAFNVPVSVRLSATRNYAKAEEEIEAVLFAIPARLVFKRDEQIFAKEIDGTQSDAKIFNQLINLVDKGEEKARAVGMVPLLKQDEVFYAEGTNEQIFEALRRIQDFNKRVTVKIRAKEPTTAIERLQIRFEISEAAPAENDSTALAARS